MTTVWKYPLMKDGSMVETNEVPGSPLHVDFDPAGNLCVWTLMDDGPDHQVTVVGTGAVLPAGKWRYLNTFQSPPFVFHAFASTPEDKDVPWVGPSGHVYKDELDDDGE